MDGRPSIMSYKPGNTVIPARMVITEIMCGCVTQSWETKNANGIWEANVSRTFPCPMHMPALMKGTDWEDHNG